MRSITVRESEWSVDDVAALIASRRRAHERRMPTGYTYSEATDPANADAFYVNRTPLGIPTPLRDFSMKALEQARTDYYKAFPEAKGDQSLVWPVHRRGDSPR